MTTHRKYGSGSWLPKTEHQHQPLNISSRARLHLLDNLRIFLTCLVIIHHTAIPYGGMGSWEFHSPCFPLISYPLAIFNAIDQTFFMALFYWMAGLFSHFELQRRGISTVARRDFIRSRVRRLIVPSIFYTLFLEPLLKTMVLLRYCAIVPSHCDGKSSIFMALRTFVAYWYEVRGIKGPVWFCVVLAIFDATAAILATMSFPRLFYLLSPQSIQTPKVLAKVLIPVIFATFLLRSWYPVGAVFKLLNLQPAFLIQYIFAYALGHASAAAGVNNLRFASLYPSVNPLMNPLRTLAVALIFQTLTLSIVFGSAYALKDEWEDPFNYIIGGINLPAFLYTVWNEVGFITIGPALVNVFAQHFQQPFLISLPWRNFTIANAQVNVARYSFATFLVHPVVSLAVVLIVESMIGCQGVDARMQEADKPVPISTWSIGGPVVMTVVVGGVNVLMSWAVAIGLLDLWPELGGWV